MSDDTNKWIAEVMGSLEGMKRATPPEDLFERMEQQLTMFEAQVIPISRYRLAVAAAILLLFLNVSVLYQNAQIADEVTSELNLESNDSLISDYQLYDL